MDESVVKVSLCMIVRNCAKDLDKCLASIAEHVDEICLTYAGEEDDPGRGETLAVAKKYGAKISFFKWCGDFSAARNYNFSQASHDVVMWLDSDDTVENAATFMRAVKDLFAKGTDSVLCEYLYEFDKRGNCTTRLLRERVVDRRLWEWRAPIHECLCAVWNSRLDVMKSELGRIIHGKKRENTAETKRRLLRNLEIFEAEFSEGDVEARMLYYWANTLVGLGRYSDALDKYDEYLAKGGRPEERYAALVSCSESARMLMDQRRAQGYAMRAIEMYPNFPSAYLSMAESSLANQEWTKAISFAVEAINRYSCYEDEMVTNPTALMGRPLFIKVYAYTHLGKYQEAARLLPQAKQWCGDDENFKAVSDIINSIIGVSNLTQAYRFLKQRLVEEENEDRIEKLRDAVPDLIKEEPEVCRDMPKVRPSQMPSIAIVCPPTPEIWGPSSRLRGGIGGSETAVINMSTELAKRGWWVEVYAHTADRGVHDGVTWYPIRSWSGESDELDVVVFWRTPNAPRNFGVNARVTYLWLHDIAIKSAWNIDTHLLYDGIMCLSKYHRSLFDWVPDDKIFMTSNAMDPTLFVPIDELQNDPNRLVWGSCPSRGLQWLLPWWGYIREKCSAADLHVFYGFTSVFREHMKHSQELRNIHKTITDLQNQPGVVWRGRIGQRELYREYARGGFWPYMTTFPEIQCITAMEMQAHGVLPVASDFAALPEVVVSGDLVPGDMSNLANQQKFVDILVKRINDPPPREERLRVARSVRGRVWSDVAKQWDERFRRDLGCSKERRVVKLGSKDRVLSRA